MYRVILKSVAAVATVFYLSNSASAVEVYMFKGAGDFSFVNDNMHFSRGLTKMADTLNAEGIHAEVRRFGATEDALKTIRKRKPESIALVGHSMGALASMSIARQLKAEGIKIAYMGLIDIPGPMGVAGENVEWVENYFSMNPVYGKLTNVRTHRKAKNIHVFGYIHNRMDDSPKVQNGMLTAIREVHAAEQELQPQLKQPEVRSAALEQSAQPTPLYLMDMVSTPVPQGNQVQQQTSNSESAVEYNPPSPDPVSNRPVPTPPRAIDPISTASIANSASVTGRNSTKQQPGRYVGNLGKQNVSRVERVNSGSQR
ncbi:MAG: thioesterase domain-containing protein [Pseudomonadota bacterium]